MWVDPLSSDPVWVRYWLTDTVKQKMLPFFKKQEIEITSEKRVTQLQLLYDFLSNEMKLPSISGDNDFFRVKLDDATVTWYTLKYG